MFSALLYMDGLWPENGLNVFGGVICECLVARK